MLKKKGGSTASTDYDLRPLIIFHIFHLIPLHAFSSVRTKCFSFKAINLFGGSFRTSRAPLLDCCVPSVQQWSLVTSIVAGNEKASLQKQQQHLCISAMSECNFSTLLPQEGGNYRDLKPLTTCGIFFYPPPCTSMSFTPLPPFSLCRFP